MDWSRTHPTHTRSGCKMLGLGGFFLNKCRAPGIAGGRQGRVGFHSGLKSQPTAGCCCPRGADTHIRHLSDSKTLPGTMPISGQLRKKPRKLCILYILQEYNGAPMHLGCLGTAQGRPCVKSTIIFPICNIPFNICQTSYVYVWESVKQCIMFLLAMSYFAFLAL